MAGKIVVRMEAKREEVSLSRCLIQVFKLSNRFLTFTFDELALLTPRLGTIGFVLGLTVAFVVVVDGVTRFFVLFPVWVTFDGFFAFWVDAETLLVVTVLGVVPNTDDAVTWISRLC